MKIFYRLKSLTYRQGMDPATTQVELDLLSIIAHETFTLTVPPPGMKTPTEYAVTLAGRYELAAGEWDEMMAIIKHVTTSDIIDRTDNVRVRVID